MLDVYGTGALSLLAVLVNLCAQTKQQLSGALCSLYLSNSLPEMLGESCWDGTYLKTNPRKQTQD